MTDTTTDEFEDYLTPEQRQRADALMAARAVLMDDGGVWTGSKLGATVGELMMIAEMILNGFPEDDEDEDAPLPPIVDWAGMVRTRSARELKGDD